jgi:hypothetical protein
MKQRVKIVTPVIDNYLIIRPRDERAVHCFHPSGLHECPRKVYDSYMGVKFHTGMDDPRLQRVADNGHDVHDRLQRCLKEAGLLIDAEVPVHDEKYQICGHCDGIIRARPGDERCDDNLGILEIKSIHERGYRTLYKPKPEHVGQVSLYMYLLGLNWGVLLYENKNDQRHTEFFVRYDRRYVLPLLDKIKYVKKYIKIKQPPPAVGKSERQTFFCDWCNHTECI